MTAVFAPGPAGSAGATERPSPPPATAAHRTAPRPTRGEPLNGNDESYWPGVMWGLATLAVVVVARLAWRRGPPLPLGGGGGRGTAGGGRPAPLLRASEPRSSRQLLTSRSTGPGRPPGPAGTGLHGTSSSSDGGGRLSAG